MDIATTPQGERARRLRLSKKSILLTSGTILIVALAIIDANELMEAARFAAYHLLIVSPVILFGLLLTAAITASGSMALIAAAFRGNEKLMILLASLIGALTPVCGVTVLPLVAGLLSGGVPFAPIMAFWLSSPVTDPAMLAVTAGTLGLPFAIGKTVSAFGAGIFGGIVVWLLTRAGRLADPARMDVARQLSGSGCGCAASESLLWKFWTEKERLQVFRGTSLANGKLMVCWLLFAFGAEYYSAEAFAGRCPGNLCRRRQRLRCSPCRPCWRPDLSGWLCRAPPGEGIDGERYGRRSGHGLPGCRRNHQRVGRSPGPGPCPYSGIYALRFAGRFQLHAGGVDVWLDDVIVLKSNGFFRIFSTFP